MLGQPPSRARLEMAPATTVGLLLLPAVSSLGCGSAAGKGSGKEQGEVRHRPSMATSSGGWGSCVYCCNMLRRDSRFTARWFCWWRPAAFPCAACHHCPPRLHTFCMSPSVARLDLDVTYSASEFAMLLQAHRRGRRSIDEDGQLRQQNQGCLTVITLTKGLQSSC